MKLYRVVTKRGTVLTTVRSKKIAKRFVQVLEKYGIEARWFRLLNVS